MRYPLHVWGAVVRPPDGEPLLLAVRVEPSANGSFSVLVRDPAGAFDVWLESEEDVFAYLTTMEIRWPAEPEQSDMGSAES